MEFTVGDPDVLVVLLMEKVGGGRGGWVGDIDVVGVIKPANNNSRILTNIPNNNFVEKGMKHPSQREPSI